MYADRAALAAYLHVDEAALPADADRWLERASEQVDDTVLTAVDVTDAGHVAGAQRAVCAIVEAWALTRSDAAAVNPAAAGSTLQVGPFIRQQGSTPAPVMPPRAIRALRSAGLLDPLGW